MKNLTYKLFLPKETPIISQIFRDLYYAKKLNAVSITDEYILIRRK